jgi:arylsulfatase A-like enzyme
MIPADLPLLAEQLHAAGYRTHGVTANGHLDGRFGFDRGFDRYANLGFADGEEVEAVVEQWRGELAEDTPFFLWVHLFDPHAPYREHPAAIRDAVPEFDELASAARVRMGATVIVRYLERLQVTADSAELDYALALYDGEIRRTDALIGRLLRSVAPDDDALVVVTSDHGEEFLDHGGFGHGDTLFEEAVRVPLIVRLPGQAHAGRVVDAPVSLIDIAPSVLTSVGVPPAAGIQGRSLVPALEGAALPDLSVFASLDRMSGERSRSIRLGRWKYVWAVSDPRSHRLFDLGDDPLERRNLIRSRPRVAEGLARNLAVAHHRATAARLASQRLELSADEVERLATLGYVETSDGARPPGRP